MATGLFVEALERLCPSTLPISFNLSVPGEDAAKVAASLTANAPSPQDAIYHACMNAYDKYSAVVDGAATACARTARDKTMRPHIEALHNYNWAWPFAQADILSPLLGSGEISSAMKDIRGGGFATEFLGVSVDLSMIFGLEGGVGFGFPVPHFAGNPTWLAYGGLKISTNISASLNLNMGMFSESISEVAGPYCGIELAVDPIEGMDAGFGVHMSLDLQEIRGFTVFVGAELGALPVTAAIGYGQIITGFGG